MVIIHSNFSYPTCSGWLPDLFFRIFLNNVHKDKHGSDTGTYDHEGRFVPQKFEDIFSKYAGRRKYLTIGDVANVLKGQRCIADPIGWFGAFFECKSIFEFASAKFDANNHRGCYVYLAMARGWPHDEGGHSWRL